MRFKILSKLRWRCGTRIQVYILSPSCVAFLAYLCTSKIHEVKTLISYIRVCIRIYNNANRLTVTMMPYLETSK